MARNTDPQTSHDAARSIQAEHLRQSQEAVLMVIRSLHRCTDVELIRSYSLRGYAFTLPQSDSGLRTRRCELVRAGLVRDSGARVKLDSGRNAIVWEAV